MLNNAKLNFVKQIQVVSSQNSVTAIELPTCSKFQSSALLLTTVQRCQNFKNNRFYGRIDILCCAHTLLGLQDAGECCFAHTGCTRCLYRQRDHIEIDR